MQDFSEPLKKNGKIERKLYFFKSTILNCNMIKLFMYIIKFLEKK